MTKSKLLHYTAVFFILCLSLTRVPLAATTMEEHNTVIIGDINIHGLTRTKESVVRKIIPYSEGDSITLDATEVIEQLLLKTAVFSEVRVELTRSSTDAERQFGNLDIYIVEKWTLIPVPYFATNGNSYSGGLFLIEANLLGYNKFLLTALYGGSAGLRGLFVFSNPSLGGTRWSQSIVGGFGSVEIEQRLANTDLIRAYRTQYYQVGTGIGYAWTPTVSTEVTARYRQWNIENTTLGLSSTPITSMSYVEPEILLSYDNTRLSDVLRIGTTAALSGRWIIPETGWEIRGDISWSISTCNQQRFRILASGGYGDMPPLAETAIDSQDGFRTLPYKGSTADRWGSVMTSYDIPVVTSSWAVIMLTPYAELGFYETESIRTRAFYGPGIGTRLYLRKVAIPAIGVDLAYNVADSFWSFSFTVGVQM